MIQGLLWITLPSGVLDVTDPLTPFWLAATTFFETGLGLAVYGFYLKVVPYFHRKSQAYVLLDPEQVRTTHNPISLLLPLPFWPASLYQKRKFTLGAADQLVQVQPKRPVHVKSWIFYVQFLRTGSFLVLFTATGLVLTSVGWVNPFVTAKWYGITAPGWLFDLAFARVNAQPNGAHVISELMIMLVGWVAALKYRDQFGPDCMIGLLAAGFLLPLHEGPWEAAYYLVYSQFLTPALWTNVLKDVSFASMIVLFYLAFKKYPLQRIRMRSFLPITVIWLIFLASWVVVPWFFGMGLLPISTINNFVYGHGVYSVTQWFGNLLVEGYFETGSWVLCGLGVTITILREKSAPVQL